MQKAIICTAYASLFITLNVAYSQTSLLQDKGGETSIVMGNKKAVSFNAGDANVLVSMSFNKPMSFWGGSAKFKSTDGISTILDGYKFNPEVDLSLFRGDYFDAFAESGYKFIYYGVSYKSAKFNLLKNDNSNTFDSKRFNGFTGKVGFNWLGSANILRPSGGVASSILFGVSAEFGKINNVEDLKAVQTFATTDVSTGSTTITSEKDKKQGFDGDYFATDAFRINLDAYIFPQLLGGRLGTGGYIRSQLSGKSPRNSMGLGIVLGQAGAPTNIVLGLLYQFNDVFNQLGEENNFFKRGGINLIAGYNF